MKKIICTATMVLLVASAAMAFAQNASSLPNREEIRAKFLQEMQVTDTQRPTVIAIMDDAAAKRQALLRTIDPEMSRLDKISILRQVREVSENARTQLATVLTPEQMKIYDKRVEEIRAKIRNRVKEYK